MTKFQKALFVLFSIVFFCIPLLLNAPFISSETDVKPQLEKGVLNLNNNRESQSLQLNGEMEFYYNQWLITDEVEDRKMTGYLNMPGFWTSLKNENGEKLSKNGYGTYLCTVRGFEKGTTFFLDNIFYYSTFRVYFNSHLIASSGTLSKERKEDKKAIRTDYYGTYKAEDVLQIAIEVGNSGQAGIVKSPYLKVNDTTVNSRRSKELLLFTALGIIAISALLLIVASFISEGKTFGFHYLFAFIAIFIYWLFSAEGLRIMSLVNITNISFPTYKTISLIAFSAFISFYIGKNKIGKHEKKLNWIFAIFTLINAVLTISIVFTQNYAFSIIPSVLLILISFLFNIYLVMRDKEMTSSKQIESYSLSSLLSVEFILSFSNACLVNNQSEYSISITILLIILAFHIAFFLRLLKIKKTADHRGELEEEERQIKSLALKEQIKPRSIFSSLNIIQSFYHSNISKGEKALDIFAKNLRYNINTMDKILVPFNDEIASIVDFSDFENMRTGKEISLVLDLDYTDFLIPPVLIKPFIVNAYNQPLLSSKEDFDIVISSVKKKRTAEIKIIDYRGCYNIWDNNEYERLKERLSLSVGGDIHTNCDNNSTIVTIHVPIPYKAKGEKHD